MSKKQQNHGLKQVYQLVMIQVGIVAFITLLVWVFSGLENAWSIAAGGIASLIPNAYQGYSVFKEHHPSAAKRIVMRLFATELLKFIFVGFSFVVLMLLTKLNVLFFVLGFLIAQIGIWICYPILLTVKK